MRDLNPPPSVYKTLHYHCANRPLTLSDALSWRVAVMWPTLIFILISTCVDPADLLATARSYLFYVEHHPVGFGEAQRLVQILPQFVL